MSDPAIVLHQFVASHFNEKARWALDHKGLAHRRETYLPGPHMPQIKKLSGQTSVPVLTIGDEVIAGSAAIIDRLERLRPENPLYPADAAHRARALEIQAYFDQTVGPKIRTAVFSVLLDEPAYMTEMFGAAHSATRRALFRASLPMVAPLIRKGNGVTSPEAIEDAFEKTQAGFDFVAKNVGESGYLVGDRFSVADLAAAALLAPALNPAHPDMARPTPIPESMQRLLDRYASHPGARWAYLMYEKHRPAPCNV